VFFWNAITKFNILPHKQSEHTASVTLSAIIQCVHKRMVQFQKLTRNSFLTLHGHNVHSHQCQLSKFLMCYQQLASHHYYGAAGPVYKMASQQENAFCVLRFEVLRSVITVHETHAALYIYTRYIYTHDIIMLRVKISRD
jgi:hypothetical protein